MPSFCSFIDYIALNKHTKYKPTRVIFKNIVLLTVCFAKDKVLSFLHMYLISFLTTENTV